ncbi:MAG TPA: lysylphosphatidylglycerol synthase domain-containing protein, partial [Euzebya sp.]|nr:lysylphosphatidylglycerol synthase domain-containing protein [Euzebya sp.]
AVAVIGTVIAVVALRDVVDGAALRAGMASAAADLPGLVLALAAFGGAFLLRAGAWCRTLPGLGFGQALAGIHVALGANHLLPLRLGEPLRVVSVVRRAGIGIAEATASTIVLRTADIIALLGLGMASGPVILGRLLGPWAAAVAVVLAAVVISAALVMARQRRRGLAVRLPDVGVVAMTAAAWALEAVLVWQVARWFGLPLEPREAVVVLAAAVGAQLLAVTPGGIGTYEAAAAAALAALGVPLAFGVTVALSIHGLKTLYSLPAGLLGALLPSPGLVGRLRLPRRGPVRPPRRAAAGPIVLFMPALDEAPRVGDVVRRTPPTVLGHAVRVLVVDDGSTDGTAANAREAGAEVVSHEANQGLGAAVRTGLAWATRVDACAVAFCDADGEYDPAALEDLVTPVLDGTADYVVGSRFGGTIRHMRPHRRLGNVALTAWVRWTVRRPVSDGQSGYRAFSPAAAAAAHIPHDYNYAQVLTIDLVAKGFTYHEVGIDYGFRASGDSFVRLGRYLRSVVPTVWRQLNATPPVRGRTSAPELVLR